MSDVHIDDSYTQGGSSATVEGQKKKLENAFDWYNTQGVDAVLITGDITGGGTKSEWDTFKGIREEHLQDDIQLVAHMGNHESMGRPAEDWAANFEEATGNKPVQDHVINGIHVISIAAGTGPLDEETGRLASHSGSNYSASVEWLRERLDAAVEEDPTKPIFVMIHYPIEGTHWRSESDRGSGLGTGETSFLNDYPQVITLHGHVHLPNTDPRAIWQKGFTSVNVADSYYHYMDAQYVGASPSVRSTNRGPAGNDKYNNDVANGMIVEIDGSVVTIRTYDFKAEMYTNQVWTFDVTKPEAFPYTNARFENGALPVFKEEAKIRATDVTATTASFTFDQAYISGNNELMENVHSYKFEFINTETDAIDLTFRQWSDFMFTDMQKTYTQRVNGLTEGVLYELRITPYASFQKEGAQYLSSYFVPRATVEAETLTLTPGATATAMSFTWYSDREVESNTSAVKIAKKSEMNSSAFPIDVVIAEGTVGDATAGKRWHKVTVTGLEQDTVYVYSVSNDKNIYSEIYEFKTGAADAFSFAVVGDPQLTTGNQDSTSNYRPGGSVGTTKEGWQDTISAMAGKGIDFIAGVGDQVDASLTTNEAEYANFFAPQEMQSIPFAPAVGNHDRHDGFAYHYSLPNEQTFATLTGPAYGNPSPQQAEAEARGNYYYSYNNALFVVLNTSSYPTSAEAAEAVVARFDATLQAAVAANPGYDWLFVQHHKSTASVADHVADRDIQYYVEAGFEKVMDKYGVDFVLAGHDHVYARSYPMYDGVPDRTGAGEADNSLTKGGDGADYATNPAGTVYFTT
ncbi:MAG: metallophosphoesterase, partial [Clostridiales bacterium]|nr:metallophosphoesterase [Clostridiales bacterium]